MATGTPIQDSSNDLHPEYNCVELVKNHVTGHLENNFSASAVARQFNFSLSTLHLLFENHHHRLTC